MFRRYISQWLIVVTSLVLAAFFIVVAFELDQQKYSWLNMHPVTANLIAGVLGLPLSFLVVNLAAQWALDWSEQRQWRVVRAVASAGLGDTWNTVRDDYVYRYSLEGTNQVTNLKLEESISFLDRDWSARIAAAKDSTGATAAPSSTVEQLHEHIWTVEAYMDQLRSAGVGLSEEVYRRRLIMHVLPRFEDARFEPDLIAQTQKAIDVLVDLGIKWEIFSDIYDGLFYYFSRESDMSDAAWPLKFSIEQMERYRGRLEPIGQLFAAARAGLKDLDDLAATLSGPPPAPQWRLHWPRRGAPRPREISATPSG